MMTAGPFIAGIAVELLSAVVLMYCVNVFFNLLAVRRLKLQSKIATSQDCGKLSGLLQRMLSWGFLVASWLGYGCFKVNSDFQFESGCVIGNLLRELCLF